MEEGGWVMGLGLRLVKPDFNRKRREK